MKDEVTQDLIVTNGYERGTIFAHYQCAVRAQALNTYTYYGNKENMSKTTSGVCPFCKREWYLKGHKPADPLSYHFI